MYMISINMKTKPENLHKTLKFVGDILEKVKTQENPIIEKHSVLIKEEKT